MKISTNTGQAFISVETIIGDILEAQENDGKIDIIEAIKIITNSLDEITKVFSDDEGKITTIVSGLKEMLSKLSQYMQDGSMSRVEIFMLALKIVQLITDVIKILD